MGVLLTSQRGHLFFLLIGLLIATALSRVITYIWVGRRPDFSLKEPIVLKETNGSHANQAAPLVLSDNLPIEEIKRQIDSSPYDFSVLTDEGGYFSGVVTDSVIIETLLQKQNGSAPVREIMTRDYPVVRDNMLSAGRIRQMLLERNLRFVPALGSDGIPPDPDASHPGVGGYFSPSRFTSTVARVELRGRGSAGFDYSVTAFVGTQSYTGPERRTAGGVAAALTLRPNERFSVPLTYSLDNYGPFTQQTLQARLVLHF